MIIGRYIIPVIMGPFLQRTAGMTDNHTLGRLTAKVGEILTFTYDEVSQGKYPHLTVVVLVDFDLSLEMANFCEETDRSGTDIYTENILPEFLQSLALRNLIHVGEQKTVHVGHRGRPSARFMNEYKFDIYPESYWEDKLIAHYRTNTFEVNSHQHHRLTIMMDMDAPFTAHASIVDIRGEYLGHLRLSVLPDDKHALINDDDKERIRLALQADITTNVTDIQVMVERVELTSNPDFGRNAFKSHSSYSRHGKYRR